MSSEAVELKIEGLVQGVGFRYFCYQKANQLNLCGWVRNNFDSSVQLYAEGERSLLQELIEIVKVGPEAAVVNDIKIEWKKKCEGCDKFEIRR